MDQRKRQMTIDGLPVLDATKSETISITAADIKKGRSKEPSKCAAAVACMRQFHVHEALIHRGRAYLRHKDHWLRYLVPAALRSEIVAVDRGGTFEPGQYTLHKIQPSRAHDVSRDTGKRKVHKKKRFPYHLTANVRRVAERTM